MGNLYGPSAATGLGAASGAAFWTTHSSVLLLMLAIFTLVGAALAVLRLVPRPAPRHKR